MPITFDKDYKGYPINANKEKRFGCKTEILDKAIEMIDYATGKHNKVLVTRVDVRFPEGQDYPDDNKIASEFSAGLMKDLSRNKLDPSYLMVREREDGDNQHYHLLLCTDGNKHQFPNKIIAKVEKHWNRRVGSDRDGLVDYCIRGEGIENPTNYYLLKNNDPDFEKVKGECIKRSSYLAKERTKGDKPKHTREVFRSRIAKDKK